MPNTIVQYPSIRYTATLVVPIKTLDGEIYHEK